MIVHPYDDVIQLSGPLEFDYSEAMETAIAMILERHPSGVIFDCSEITHITEEGAETFQSAIDFVLHHRARLIFAAVPKHVEQAMRKVPEVRSQMATSDSVEEARQSLDVLAGCATSGNGKKVCTRQILVCLCPNSYDEHVMDVTQELISTLPAKITLLMPVVVPRELPLQAPLPAVEQEAGLFAERARKSLSEQQMPYEIRLERTRDLPSLVSEIAEEVDAAHVVVGVDPREKEEDEMTKMFHNLLDKVERPLMFVRGRAKATV